MSGAGSRHRRKSKIWQAPGKSCLHNLSMSSLCVGRGAKRRPTKITYVTYTYVEREQRNIEGEKHIRTYVEREQRNLEGIRTLARDSSRVTTSRPNSAPSAVPPQRRGAGLSGRCACVPQSRASAPPWAAAVAALGPEPAAAVAPEVPGSSRQLLPCSMAAVVVAAMASALAPPRLLPPLPLKAAWPEAPCSAQPTYRHLRWHLRSRLLLPLKAAWPEAPSGSRHLRRRLRSRRRRRLGSRLARRRRRHGRIHPPMGIPDVPRD